MGLVFSSMGSKFRKNKRKRRNVEDGGRILNTVPRSGKLLALTKSKVCNEFLLKETVQFENVQEVLAREKPVLEGPLQNEPGPERPAQQEQDQKGPSQEEQGQEVPAQEKQVQEEPAQEVLVPEEPALNRLAQEDVHKYEKYDEFKSRLGYARGIQGYKNSCYLDTLLFSMFFGLNTFDTILEERIADDEFIKKVRQILDEKIALPLNQEPFSCSYKNTMMLRKCLAKINERVLWEFMAIEDIVHLLFEQALKENSMINYGEGGSSNMHILSANVKDRRRSDIQKNFDFSMFVNGNLEFLSVPFPALFLGLQWHGQQLYHYSSVAPVPELHIRNKMTPAFCTKCQETAAWEFYSKSIQQPTIECPNQYLCHVCINDIKITHKDTFYLSRETMRLRAIICYKGYHFTTIVRYSKDNSHRETCWNTVKWVYFNSLSQGSYKVVDVTEKIYNLFKTTEKPNRNTWKKSFENFDRFHVNVHTCVYEPIKFTPNI